MIPLPKFSYCNIKNRLYYNGMPHAIPQRIDWKGSGMSDYSNEFMALAMSVAGIAHKIESGVDNPQFKLGMLIYDAMCHGHAIALYDSGRESTVIKGAIAYRDTLES